MTMQTFTGLEYLKIDIANNFGLDKKDWDDRIAWFDQHETNLEKMVKQSDEPALFYAGIQAYRQAVAGLPIGYPISLDACCSGLQILATLIGCEQSAKLCGVIDTGHREDAYTTLYQDMCEVLGQGTNIKRSQTKDAIMTALYGSTAIPKQVFGEGEQYDVFLNTMATKAKGAWELNLALQEIWDAKKTQISWQLPDLFKVEYDVRGKETENIQFFNAPYEVTTTITKATPKSKSLGPNIVHSIDGMIVREMVRRCSFDPVQMERIRRDIESKNKSDSKASDKVVNKLWQAYLDSGFLSTRILEFLNEDNMGNVDALVILDLLETFPKKPFKLITVHDCFRALPTYGNDVRQQYNRILHDIGQSNLLSYIVSQHLGVHTPVKKYGNFGDKILHANYSLS